MKKYDKSVLVVSNNYSRAGLKSKGSPPGDGLKAGAGAPRVKSPALW